MASSVHEQPPFPQRHRPATRFLVGPAGGSDAFGAESIREALEVIRQEWPEAVAYDREGRPVSCDADTTPGIPVLVWASEADSLDDDDGRRAITQILLPVP